MCDQITIISIFYVLNDTISSDYTGAHFPDVWSPKVDDLRPYGGASPRCRLRRSFHPLPEPHPDLGFGRSPHPEVARHAARSAGPPAALGRMCPTQNQNRKPSPHM